MKHVAVALLILVMAVLVNRAFPSPQEIYSDELADVEVRCLTQAIYFEARSEPELSQRAVAEVILNRRDSGTFPNFVCDVITDKGQFEWFHGWPMKPGDMDLWWKLYGVAQSEMYKRLVGQQPKDQIIPSDYQYFCSGECVKKCKGKVIGNQCYYARIKK